MELAKIDRLYHVMIELMNAPKTKDVLMKMPAYVKDGGVYDFNDRLFGGAGDKPDGLIFAKPDRVHNAQAITSALKRDYTKALKEWLDGETPKATATPKDKGGKDDAEKPKKKSKKSKGTKTDDDAPKQKLEAPKYDMVGEVTELLENGKVKKAKKLIAEFESHADYKACKKLIKKAK